MFTNAGCKLLQKERDGRRAVLKEVLLSPVYWEENIGQTLTSSQNGAHDFSQSNTVTIIIPVGSLGSVMPKKDDKIVKCEDGEEIGMALTVMAVSDFRYGSKSVQHVEVTAK